MKIYLISIGVAVLGFVGYVISVTNTQNKLKLAYEAQIDVNKAEYDNMWKSISETFNVNKDYKESFIKVMETYVEGRKTESENVVSSWVKESVPNYSPELSVKVINVLNGKRDTWTMNQRVLVSKAQEYNKNLVSFPRNLFLGSHSKLEPKIITSKKTESTFDSGKDEELLIK